MENADEIAIENKTMATTKKRNVYKAKFKAKVALEAVFGRLTTNQISKWKKQFLKNLPQIFENSK